MRRLRRSSVGLTLVELAVVISVSGILFVATPPLVLQGVHTFVFLPRAQAANQVAMEILHAAMEGSHSTLSGLGGQTIRGLRFAVRQPSPAQPAIWLAENERIGFLIPHNPSITTDNQYVVLRLDGQQLKRSVYLTNACPPASLPSEEEILPYYAAGRIRVTTPNPPLFRYYNQSGALLSPPICSGTSAIRRVEMAFVAQTGGGDFSQGDAQVKVTSSVAIRFP